MAGASHGRESVVGFGGSAALTHPTSYARKPSRLVSSGIFTADISLLL